MVPKHLEQALQSVQLEQSSPEMDWKEGQEGGRLVTIIRTAPESGSETRG